MDSTGIHAVIRAKELCAGHGCEFLVILGQGQVLRLLELSGLLERLPLQIDESDPGSVAGQEQPAPVRRAPNPSQ